ncbi:MAG: SpoIIE family protein phosphatase [Bryobacteraceae bacterium]
MATSAKRLDSERAQAQLELKDRALAATAEGITIADARLPDNPLIYANAGFERLSGYSIADVLGRNCRFLQGPGTDPDTVNLLRAAVREKREITVQLLNYRKDGTTFWNRLSVTPVQDHLGTVTHFIGVQSDVTEEKQAKDALLDANQRLEIASRAMKRDLQAAAELQRSLLPVELPKSPEMRFAYRFSPCSDVGGDALNVVPLDDRHLGIYILDVSGHGVAAALLSVTLTHMLSVAPDRSFLYQRAAGNKSKFAVTSPSKVISRLNAHFVSNAEAARFFTMVYGILDKVTGEFRYTAAGHLGPIHVPAISAPRVGETGGIPVGLLAATKYEEHILTLSRGDRLYLCTDGITEAENGEEEEFGVERLLVSLEHSRNSTLGDSLSTVLEHVENWSASVGSTDDASLLAVERVR